VSHPRYIWSADIKVRIVNRLTASLSCLMGFSTTNNSGYTGSDESFVSHAFDAGEDLSLKTIIRQPQEAELPPTNELVDFKFCSNSKVLIAVTKPFIDEAGQSMLYSILTWDAINGRRLSYINSRTEVWVFK